MKNDWGRKAHLAGVFLAAALMSSCGGNVDAGTAAGEEFSAYMADVPGVVATDGMMSNSLPFRGNGDFIVELDPAVDAATMDAALEMAVSFSVPENVEISLLIVELAGRRKEAGGEVPTVSIETAWPKAPEDFGTKALALIKVAKLRYYQQETDVYDGTVTTRVGLQEKLADPCPVIAEVSQITGLEPNEIEIYYARRAYDTRCE